MIHDEIAAVVANWLRNSCSEKFPVSFMNLVSTAGEVPDVVGFNSSHSVIVEVKVSRADFKKDASKFWRQNPEFAMGDFRFYACPVDLIKAEEVPDKWGLLWVNEKGKVIVAKQILTGNINYTNPNRFKKDLQKERGIMYSALRRIFLHDKNVMGTIKAKK